MTDDDRTTTKTEADTNRIKPIRVRIWLAQLSLFWEAIWRALWPVASAAGLFVAVSLAGLWQIIEGWYHLGSLILFAFCFLWLLIVRLPLITLASREQGQRRLETDSGVAHRPLQTMDDQLAPTGTADPATARLWALSRERAATALAQLRPDWPRPGLAARDTRAIRYAVGLLLFVGLMAAGADAPQQMARAFAPNLSAPEPKAVYEAWVTPPAYTGKAPVLLTAGSRNKQPDEVSGEEELIIQVPTGSQLFVRLYGGAGQPALLAGESRIKATAVDGLNHELTWQLDTPVTATLVQGTTELQHWTFALIPDEPPQAAFEDAPSVGARLGLKIPLLATDDYGLTVLKLSLVHKQLPADTIEIRLPGLAPKTFRHSSFQDFTPHKWAGLPVTLTLIASDAAGQTGRSQTLNITLPERAFEHPVARAIIEQRKRLASDGDNRNGISRAIRVIASFPEEFNNDSVVTLALRSTIQRLEMNGPGKAVAEAIDMLWDTALRIEDGVLSLAERALRKAEQNLMDALSRNASQAEIDRLTQELKQAMDRFLQAMLEQMANNPQPENMANLPVDPNARSVDRQDLQRMLDRARELSALGARDAAREMLAQLREMLENLRTGIQQGQMSPQTEAGQKALGELGKLMRRQQELMDQSQRQKQKGNARPGDEQSKAAATEQEALRRRLGEIMRQLGEARGNIPRQLGKAERSMRGAGKSLQRGQPGEAAPQQGNALQQMRGGAEALAKAMAGERGQRGLTGQGRQPMPGQNTDPLGRPLDGMSSDPGKHKIPDENTVRRARQVLKELQDRASDLTRPPVERDYLDRLLRRF